MSIATKLTIKMLSEDLGGLMHGVNLQVERFATYSFCFEELLGEIYFGKIPYDRNDLQDLMNGSSMGKVYVELVQDHRGKIPVITRLEVEDSASIQRENLELAVEGFNRYMLKSATKPTASLLN